MYIRPALDGMYGVVFCSNGIDPPLIDESWNTRNLVVLVGVEEGADAEFQVASNMVSNFASGHYLCNAGPHTRRSKGNIEKPQSQSWDRVRSSIDRARAVNSLTPGSLMLGNPGQHQAP